MEGNESEILENPRSEEFIQVGNIDWRLEINPINDYQRGMKVSEMNPKICELATGNKSVEEWTFLPENCQHTLCEDAHQFYQNFALIDFNKFHDILMLNLATRKQFWVNGENIINQMKAKAPVGTHELHENPLNIRNDTLVGLGLGQMEVGCCKIGVYYKAILNHGYTTLGSFKCHSIKILISLEYVKSIYKPFEDCILEFSLDDGNEIYDYDVVDVDITFRPREGFLDWRELIRLY